MFISYAQNFEDVLLWRALGHVTDGFYIDVGASDPTIDSVTKAFYERGWRGINIEPLPTSHRRLCSERPRDVNLAVAAGACDGTAELFDVPSVRGWATMDAVIAAGHQSTGHDVVAMTVPVRTLASICAEHAVKDIHFLKIDAEGSEAEVIRGMDLRRWRPWILVIEAITPVLNAASHAAWEPVVTEQGYRYAYFDGLNRYYIADEQGDLRHALATQPNALDDFVSYGQVVAAEAAQNAKARATLAEAERAAITASTSWRVTRPLRELKDAGLRVRDRDVNKANLQAHFASTTRRCAGAPLRWLMARQRLRAVVDLYLPRYPALERSMRAAVRRVTANAAGLTGPMVGPVPRDPKDISLAAREALRDLYAARARANSREGG